MVINVSLLVKAKLIDDQVALLEVNFIVEVLVEDYAINCYQVLDFEVELTNVNDPLEVFVNDYFTATLAQKVELSPKASKVAQELGVKLAQFIFRFKSVMLGIPTLPLLDDGN